MVTFIAEWFVFKGEVGHRYQTCSLQCFQDIRNPTKEHTWAYSITFVKKNCISTER